MMDNYILFLLILIFIPTAIILAFIPYLTRKTENFGVSIPESMYNREEFKTMRKKYSSIMLMITIIVSIVYFIVASQAKESTVLDRKSTRLNSRHVAISYAVFCLKKRNRRLGRGRSERRLK